MCSTRHQSSASPECRRCGCLRGLSPRSTFAAPVNLADPPTQRPTPAVLPTSRARCRSTRKPARAFRRRRRTRRSHTCSCSGPPAQAGSVGSGRDGESSASRPRPARVQLAVAQPGPARVRRRLRSASGHRRGPECARRCRARCTPRRFPASPSATTPAARGSGVIRLTQCDDSHGVSTGTGIAMRRCRPAIAAYLRIISV